MEPEPESEPEGRASSMAAAEASSMVVPAKEQRKELFLQLDTNGNGGLSLAEIDRAAKEGLLGKALGVADGLPHRSSVARSNACSYTRALAMTDRVSRTFSAASWFPIQLVET